MARPAPTLHVPKFQPSTMRPDSIILLLGPRRTGKTTLCLDLLSYLNRHMYAVHVQTPTQDTIDTLSNHIPWTLMQNDFDVDAITRVYNTVKSLCDAEKQKAKIEKRAPEKRYVMVLLDDCMAESKNIKAKPIKQIFYNGRHQNVCFMNLQQYAMDMAPNLRTNIDYVISTRDNSPENQTKLWRNFFKTAFPREEDFVKTYLNCTQDFQCLILDRTISCENPVEQLFWYKAPKNVEPFRMCHDHMWKLHYKFLQSRGKNIRAQQHHIKETVRRTMNRSVVGLQDESNDNSGHGGAYDPTTRRGRNAPPLEVVASSHESIE